MTSYESPQTSLRCIRQSARGVALRYRVEARKLGKRSVAVDRPGALATESWECARNNRTRYRPTPPSAVPAAHHAALRTHVIVNGGRWLRTEPGHRNTVAVRSHCAAPQVVSRTPASKRLATSVFIWAALLGKPRSRACGLVFSADHDVPSRYRRAPKSSVIASAVFFPRAARAT